MQLTPPGEGEFSDASIPSGMRGAHVMSPPCSAQEAAISLRVPDAPLLSPPVAPGNI